MFYITILAIGKIKEKYWLTGATEYLKRLAPYCKINLVELPATSFKSATDKKSAQAAEAEKIQKFLDQKNSDRIILLNEEGASPTSMEFAEILKTENRHITFVIGGSLGFSPELKNKYEKLSLSPLTFTHEMARVILLEQIYRAIAIIKGKDYHY